MTPQEAADTLASVLNSWERVTGYTMVVDGQDTIVATIDPDTGGWRYAAHVEPSIKDGWKAG